MKRATTDEVLREYLAAEGLQGNPLDPSAALLDGTAIGLDGDLGLEGDAQRQLSAELRSLFTDLPSMGLPAGLTRTITEEAEGLMGILQPGWGTEAAGGTPRGMAPPSFAGASQRNMPGEHSGLASPAVDGPVPGPGAPGNGTRLHTAAMELQKTIQVMRNVKASEEENVNVINEANAVLGRLQDFNNMNRLGAHVAGASPAGEELGSMLTRLQRGNPVQRGGSLRSPVSADLGLSPRNPPVLVTDVAANSGLRGDFGKQAALRAEEDMRSAGGRVQRENTIGLEVLAALKRSREVTKEIGGVEGMQERRRQRLDTARAVQHRMGGGPSGNQKGTEPSSHAEVEELLRRTSSLEKNNRSLNMRLAFMNRLNSEQTIRIEQLEKEKRALEAAAEDLKQRLEQN